MVVVEQLFIADGEQRSAQRREHRELVVGPFDRRSADRRVSISSRL
jgi:hypothetical protein